MVEFDKVARAELARYAGLRDEAKYRLKATESGNFEIRPCHAKAVEMIKSEIAVLTEVVKRIKIDIASHQGLKT